jgi:hypothetical protein
VAVSDVVWRDPSLGAASTFESYYLYNGGTQIAGPSVMNTTDHSVTFALTNYVIASNTTWDPVLVATAASYASGSFRSGSMYQFALSPSGITARGVTSGITATVTGQLTQKYYVISGKTTFSVTGNIASSTVRAPSAMDRPFAVWLAAGSTGWADVSYLKFKLSGTTVPSSINAFTGDVIDAATGTNLSGTTSATASWDSGKNAWILEFRFSSSYRVTAGTSKALLLQVNSSGFANGAGSDTLTLELIAQTWGDGDAGFSVLSSSTPWTTTAAYQ